MNDNKTYSKGDRVEVPGEYICVPCGYKKHFNLGDVFGECTSCLAGSEEGDPQHVEGTAIWEKVATD